MKHLALLIPTLNNIAGAERIVLALAQAFAQRGWRVTVVTLSGDGGSARQELSAKGVEFYSLYMRKGLADPRGWWRFHKWLRTNKPDLLHAHLPHASGLARWSRLLAPVPIIIDTLHSSSTGHRLRKIGYRISNWLTDAVTAVGVAVLQTHLQARLIPEHRAVVITNGIDTEHWKRNEAARHALRSRWGLQNQFVWLAAGRLEPVKDHHTLLRAMILLPEAHLFIAGCGSQRSSLQKFIEAHQLQARVHLVGFLQDLVPWLSAADGFVQASLWEGLPLTLLEAGACMLPCVATDVAGNNEVLQNGLTGHLVPGGNAVALASAMNELMQQSNDDRTDMAYAAREHIVAHFEQETSFDKWEQLYLTLLRHRRPVSIFTRPYLRK